MEARMVKIVEEVESWSGTDTFKGDRDAYLHWRAHGVEEVDNNEGEDGEPLLPRETGHGNVLSPDGLKFEPNIMKSSS